MTQQASTAVQSSTDTEAIANLRAAFASQKAAFIREVFPSLDERREHLGALAGMVVGNRDRIRAAMSEDFGVHPELFTDLIETLGVAGRAMYAAEQLEAWMAPEERPADPALFGTARAAVRQQPKGVVGNISPWNFPFDLSLGPLVEMLAAGNRVIIKPSEYTPACGELLRDMIAAPFDPDRVTVVTGGLELARMFPTLTWDHLLYTGSPEVGRLIALAAAENLVPVTLELGGKNPVVVHEDSVTAETVAQIIGTKLVKNGQMCISADYCLVPRGSVDAFVRLAQEHVTEHLPGYAGSANCTGIVSARHLDRLAGLLDEARESGARVVPLEPEAEINRSTRQMPLSLVVDPSESTGVMQEEIFGPILPIKPYDTLDEAIDYVNAAARPLGLYVFAEDEAVAERVLAQTSSGGACVNTCAIQGALPSLGFGGVGNSGTGRHHGIEGFREFSNPRGVVVRGKNDLVDVLFPPYGQLAEAVVGAAFGGSQDGEQS